MSTEGSGNKQVIPPTHQAMATFAQVVNQNTWYTVLDTTPNVGVRWFVFNMATADETIETRITIDGQTYTSTGANATAANNYEVVWYGTTGASKTRFIDPINNYRGGYIFAGKSIKIEIRKTTAAGANILNACVCYVKW